MIEIDSVERAPARVTASETQHSAVDLLIIIARRKGPIFRLTVVAVFIATVVAFLLPKQYTADTIVLPPTQGPSMASMLMNQLGSGALASITGANLGIKNPGDMYVSLFRTRTVEDAVIGRFGLMARYREKEMTDARKTFEKHATVTLGAKDGLITISVRDRDPKLAAEIANGYVEELRRLSANLAITEASQRRLFFQQQLVEAKVNLASAEEAMKNTEQSTGILQIDSQAKALIESAAALRAQIVAKQVQLRAMRSFATEENPQLVTVKEQIAALHDQLAKLAGTGSDSSSGLIVPKGKIPGAGMEYIRKYRDLKYYETIYELIAKQFEMAKLDEARQGAVIQVADVAVPPDKKSSPKRALIIAVSTVLAFLIGVFWAVSAEGLANAKRDPEQEQKLRTLRKYLWSR